MTDLPVLAGTVVPDELAPVDPRLVTRLYQLSEELRAVAREVEIAIDGRDVVTGFLREVSAPDPAQASSDMDRWQRTTARSIASEAATRLAKRRSLVR